MSKNRKYIEQFDRESGKPSEFDSLFRFEGKELIANRRIRARNSGRRAAAMLTAAAVIGVGAFAMLTHLSTEGFSSWSDAGDETSLTAGAPYEIVTAPVADGEKLSGLISAFDYTLAQQQGAAGSRMVPAEEGYPPVIMRFRVVQKQYISDDYGDSYLVYEVSPEESYILNEDGDMYFGGNITVNARVNGDIREMQEGCEYIAPLYIEESDAYGSRWVLSAFEEPVRRTDAGWIIGRQGVGMSFNAALSEDAVRIENDVDYLNDYFLEWSDIKLNDKIERYYLRGSGLSYRRNIWENDVTAAQTLESILPDAGFESVRYGNKADGSVDKTLLVLDNQLYFTFSPQLTGTVVYAGRATDGRQMAVIRLEGKSAEEGYARTMLVTGFVSLNVSAGDRPYEGQIIGECGQEPLYMRFISSSGEPVEIDINSDASAFTTVISID